MTLDEAALRYGRCLIEGNGEGHCVLWDNDADNEVHGRFRCEILGDEPTKLCTLAIACVMYAQDVAAGRHAD